MLLLSPPEPHQQLPESHGLRLLHLALPLSVTGLRAILAELYSERRRENASPPPALDKRAGTAPCILVAEDNRVNQMVVQGFLHKRGYSVRMVNNGRSAVDEYRRAPGAIQLVLMDCEMPELDGFEATRQIRALEADQNLPAVPIIALTAHILEEHRARGLAAGMDDFLGKPLDCQQLYATLDRYLLAQAHATE